MKTILLFITVVLTGVLSFNIASPGNIAGYILFVSLWSLFQAFAAQLVTLTTSLRTK